MGEDANEEQGDLHSSITNNEEGDEEDEKCSEEEENNSIVLEALRLGRRKEVQEGDVLEALQG